MKKENENVTVPDIDPYVSSQKEKVRINAYGLDGKYIQTFESIYQAAKTLKVSACGISLCLTGKSRRASNFQFRKAEN